ncbi:ATP-binding protein [Salinigranum marinum]|uniref:sensor histidine kinase n=1 Tax=Salinigranum marinum TaxID=1515595 RepID=UPI002989EDCE|nr:ATP-binding protein [Salinigranum marinum]
MLTLARQGETVGETTRVAGPNFVESCWELSGADSATVELVDSFDLFGDRSRLRYVFENLLRNTVEHGPDDVTVHVGRTGEGLYVEDEGLSIPIDKHETVYQPSHSSASGGTGFGLSIVRRIAEAHESDVDITERSAGGS